MSVGKEGGMAPERNRAEKTNGRDELKREGARLSTSSQSEKKQPGSVRDDDL